MIRRRAIRSVTTKPVTAKVAVDASSLEAITQRFEAVQQSLLQTQKEVNEVWTEVSQLLTLKSPAPAATNTPSVVPPGSESQDESLDAVMSAVDASQEKAQQLIESSTQHYFDDIEALQKHEHALSEQKISAVAAQANAINAALAKTQGMLTNVAVNAEGGAGASSEGAQADGG